MSSSAALTQFSRVLIESLADAGVCHVVISPGSRSTPLVLSALACERLSCEWLIDERSAAFYAVSRAKTSGRPCALVCTSGSAAANYYPAVVEASLSYTPLVVLTADRPHELQQCGASQTIDQTKLYGSFVRYFADLGLPEGTLEALRGLRRTVAQAVTAALYGPAGPVHLNFRARKPLEPPLEPNDADRQMAARADQVLARPITRAEAPAREPTLAILHELGRALDQAERPMMLLGPASAAEAGPELAQAIATVASRTDLAVYAEATSQVRLAWPAGAPAGAMADALGILLSNSSFARHCVPDLVVQVGAPPVSAGVDAFVRAHPQVSRWVISEAGWPDPAGTADRLIFGARPASVMNALAGVLGERANEKQASPWRRWLGSANEHVWRLVDEVLRGAPEGEAAHVRATIDSLQDGDLLVLGNSLPVREVDTYCRARNLDVQVHHQRGTSGIEGYLAATAGAAKQSGRPTTALIGDLTFLHDLGGLAALSSVPVPVAIVVLNNGGGRIFEQLPVATTSKVAPEQLEYWTTPHRIELSRASQLFGIEAVGVRSPEGLARALSTTRQRARTTLIEVSLPAHAARDERAGLLRALEDAPPPLDAP